ncbi:hypothetical protein AV944_06770 [Sphingomonas sp. LK11]|jgi:hypothetical protein|uniref:hypothetical protein n=1 Tax=Sphingomonas sp. LK11 TaxID=1390395 RepID=UPI000972E484|nr:hypothetical protein [Sphingomonas sp. LK11]APX65599.1 hypothetical protein AV944_06770 [Sphingomonas sp. LK11]
MAKFPFSFQSFVYQSGVDRLQNAFRSSIAQIEADQAAALSDYNQYVDSGEDDSEYEGEGDERYLVRSTAFELEQVAFDIGLSAVALREAFIISAYHYWEKFADGGNGRRGFNNISKHSPYDCHAKLGALSELTNHLKHEIAFARLVTLHKEWPTLFSLAPYIIEQTGRPHWIVRLNNGHVEEAFDIVRASGPSGKGGDGW